jgi:hypothetical protein
VKELARVHTKEALSCSRRAFGACRPLGWEHIALTGDYVWSAAAPEPGFWPLRDVRTAFLPQAA